MTALTLSQLRWVAYALLIASAIPAGLCIPQFSKARHAPYYILRRSALRRATRCLLVMLVLQALAVALLIASPRLAAIVPAPTPTVTPTFTPTPTFAPRPTQIPTATPTRPPTATPPLIPTPAPSVPPPDAVLTPIPSAVPAGEDAHIELQYLAFEKDEAVEPGSEFPPGEYRVYLYFAYEGMKDGIVTTFAWYRQDGEGEFIDFCSDTWLWGLVEGREWGERGEKPYYCKLPGGWDPGAYEIRVFIEDRLQGIAQFVVTEE